MNVIEGQPAFVRYGDCPDCRLLTYWVLAARVIYEIQMH